MDIKLKGFDKLQRQLDDLAKRAQALDGTHQVSVTELFAPTFMRQHTDFESFEAMIEASGHDVQTPEDFERIPDDEWERLVKTRTRFPSWTEMQKKAGAEYFRRKLAL